MNTLYLECTSGISGDMTVGALLDLGADAQVLQTALDSLPIDGFTVEISRVKKASIDACDFNVILDKKHENHDHDMEYLHGTGDHGHEHKPGHQHHAHDHHHHHDSEGEGHHHHEHKSDNEHGHHHHHDHKPAHQHKKEGEHHHGAHGHHEHRGLKEVTHIINHAHLTDNARALAIRIFEVLAHAEAKAHASTIDKVHFHEVGAVDSIVDIVAVAVCFDNLNISQVVVSALFEGTGTVRCQHGVLPVPVPAVANIASAYGLVLNISQSQGEFITPTGAAIVAAIKTLDKLPEQFSITKIGLGAGKRNYERPSLLRAMLIEPKADVETDVIYKLESNIDDCTGEALGYVMEQLLAAGAYDVNYMPLYMKKNRPAYQINVICKVEDAAKLEQIIFKETTTIGIRRQKLERTILKRKLETRQTSLGEVRLKVCDLALGVRVYPEYDSVTEICQAHGLGFQEAYRFILKAYDEKL